MRDLRPVSWDTMKKIIDGALEFLFPAHCVACDAKGPDLCAACIQDFRWPKPRKKDKKWITSLWNYRDTHVEQVVRHIKRLPNRRIALIISVIFAERILNRPSDAGSWIITPVPISGKRFRERGYNQAELLARPIARAFGIELALGNLVKVRHTAKQGTSRSREERQKNVTGSFALQNPLLILGKKIIVVDDVATTGSTLREVRKILLDAGAAQVLAWTVAN